MATNKFDYGNIGLILLVGIMFYLAVREPLPAATIGYVSKPQPALKKKAQAKLKTTQATRKKSSPSYAQHRTKEEAEGSHGDNPTAGKGGVVAIPGTARWLATATPAQKAAYAAKKKRDVALVKQKIALMIKVAAVKVQTALKQQGGYKPVQFSAGGSGGAVMGSQLPGLAHGGTGSGIPPAGNIIASFQRGVDTLLGKKQVPTIEAWIDNKEKACGGNQTCNTLAIKQIENEVQESINATASTLSARGGSRKGGLPGVDPTLSMA